MAITSLNTRIVLRNDELSNWSGSLKPLLKGEVALARLSGELSNKFEMRIGTGDKTWSQLSSSNFLIPAENVIGLNDSIKSVQTKFYEVSAYTALPENADVTKGSVGVVLETLSAEGKDDVEFRTAYWFDTELTSATHPNGTWRQLDGNYKADEVYFTDNMKLTEQFGKYSANKTGYTLSCKNMSLAAVLADAYAETKQPAVTQPTFSFSLQKTSNSGEIGASYTLPNKATFTFTNDGNYEYGPDPTGVTTSACIVADAATGMATQTKSGMTEGNTLTASANVTSAFVDGATTYNYTAYYTSTAGATPLNNVKGNATVSPIAAQTNKSIPQTYTATGYYPTFYVVTTAVKDVPTALSSSTSKDNNGLAYTKLTNGTYEKTTFTDPDGWYQIFFLTPSAKTTKTSWSGTDSSSGLPVNPVATQTATVTLLNGQTAEYKVFIVQNSAKGDAGTATMVYA